MRFPNLCLRIALLNQFPSLLAESFAVLAGADEKEFQPVMLECVG
ncbi:hypothetical protein ACFPVS_10430 [Neisseria weixii]|nr:hypothetical protein [Neisseria weixii]